MIYFEIGIPLLCIRNILGIFDIAFSTNIYSLNTVIIAYICLFLLNSMDSKMKGSFVIKKVQKWLYEFILCINVFENNISTITFT